MEVWNVESRSARQIHLGELQMMAGHALVIPGADQAPQREPGATGHRQPGPAGPGEVPGRAGVVRRGGAARRRDPRLDGLDRFGDVEMSTVELGHGRVHELLQSVPDLIDPFDGLAMDVQIGHRFRYGRTRHDAFRLILHFRTQGQELRPAPLVYLGQIKVRAGVPARAGQVAFGADLIRLAGGQRQVGLPQPVPQLHDGPDG
jgi:hypothetical protein